MSLGADLYSSVVARSGYSSVVACVRITSGQVRDHSYFSHHFAFHCKYDGRLGTALLASTEFSTRSFHEMMEQLAVAGAEPEPPHWMQFEVPRRGCFLFSVFLDIVLTV